MNTHLKIIPTIQSSIQIIRRHNQLQTKLRWNIHIRDISLVFVLLVVAEVLADPLEHYPADVLQYASAGYRFGEVAFAPVSMDRIEIKGS